MSVDSMKDELSGKDVLIIGGTSGIGLETAIKANAAGASVTILGSNKERSAKIAAVYNFSGYSSADVADAEDIFSALTKISHVDHLVILAGSFISGQILDGDLNVLRQIFEERFWGSINILRALGDRLDEHASVTFVSGELASRPNAFGTSVLCAAVNAMEGLTKSLVLELAPKRFNILSPGPIDTPLLDKIFANERDAYIDERSKILPLHRFGKPGEVADAALFLMRNSFMNGAVINIDGGSRLI